MSFAWVTVEDINCSPCMFGKGLNRWAHGNIQLHFRNIVNQNKTTRNNYNLGAFFYFVDDYKYINQHNGPTSCWNRCTFPLNRSFWKFRFTCIEKRCNLYNNNILLKMSNQKNIIFNIVCICQFPTYLHEFSKTNIKPKHQGFMFSHLLTTRLASARHGPRDTAFH